MTGKRKYQLHGFTLVEATLSVAIVGILLVTSTATFGAIARARKSQVEGRLAYLLGQQLMTEILQCYFQQPGSNPTFGPVAGQARAAFNYVDAYDDYTASPPVSHSGAILSDYIGWSEVVAVDYVNPSSPATLVSSSTLKRITITITALSGKTYSIVSLRSKYGAYELQPTVQTNYVTGAAVTLQGASPARTVYTGSHPLNISSSQ